MVFHRLDQVPIPIRCHIEVVIDVTEKFPACCLRPKIHRFGVAEVSIVSNHPAPVRLEEPRRAVRRVIVDDDDFVGTGRVSADSFEKELIVTELIVNGDNDAQHNSI
jgi:hypothetical protein